MRNQPSLAFVFVSWAALLAGALAFLIGLWNADMMLNEKGYYFTQLMFGLFTAVSVQKSVRDREEGIPVTDTYYGISWAAAILAVLLLVIGLWNAEMTLSEKGFYAMSYALSMFAAITVQKNVRDREAPEVYTMPVHHGALTSQVALTSQDPLMSQDAPVEREP